jgi:hypothetical protein
MFLTMQSSLVVASLCLSAAQLPRLAADLAHRRSFEL